MTCGKHRPVLSVRPPSEPVEWTDPGCSRIKGTCRFRGRSRFRKGCYRGRRFRGGLGICDLFFADFLAQFSVGREKPPVSHGKTVLFVFSHNSSFDHFTFSLLRYVCKGKRRDAGFAASCVDDVPGRRGLSTNIAQRNTTIPTRPGQENGAGDFTHVFTLYLDFARQRQAMLHERQTRQTFAALGLWNEYAPQFPGRHSIP